MPGFGAQWNFEPTHYRRVSFDDGRNLSQQSYEFPPDCSGGALAPIGSVAVGLATAGPDEREALAVLVVEEVSVDWSGEARIVEFDREIIAAFGRALGPSGANLDVMRCAALGRLD